MPVRQATIFLRTAKKVYLYHIERKQNTNETKNGRV